MFHQLRRHPFAVRARFETSLVLTYALPAAALVPHLYPGLLLDNYGEWGFAAVALVKTRSLRPAMFPAWFGQSFFLAGYRIFVRADVNGRRLRGLQVLRSDADRSSICVLGSLFTHYRYHRVKEDWRRTGTELDINVKSPDGVSDLQVHAWLDDREAPLPEDSVFPNARRARNFAGPLPFTFSYEPETHGLIVVEGERESWHPRVVRVDALRVAFLEQPQWQTHGAPRLSAAFVVENIPYQWRRGLRVPVSTSL